MSHHLVITSSGSWNYEERNRNFQIRMSLLRENDIRNVGEGKLATVANLSYRMSPWAMTAPSQLICFYFLRRMRNWEILPLRNVDGANVGMGISSPWDCSGGKPSRLLLLTIILLTTFTFPQVNGYRINLCMFWTLTTSNCFPQTRAQISEVGTTPIALRFTELLVDQTEI